MRRQGRPRRSERAVSQKPSLITWAWGVAPAVLVAVPAGGDVGARGAETRPTGRAASLVAGGSAEDRGAIGKRDTEMGGFVVLEATAGATPPAGPTVMINCGGGCVAG